MDGTMYVLLPIYNEAGNLERLFSRIREGMERSGFIYHIIAYNDGSTDGSADILAGFAGKYPLTNIGDTRNHGLGHGLRTLLREVCRIAQSDDDIAVVLDSDNSHNPELFRSMVDKTRQGFDVVIASRYLVDSRVVGLSIFRKYLSVGASLVMRLLFPIKGVKDYTCGYRAYSLSCLRRAFDKFGNKLVEETSFACMAELLIKLRSMDILIVEVPLLLRYDHKIGDSKMNIFKTIKRTLRMMIHLKSL